MAVSYGIRLTLVQVQLIASERTCSPFTEIICVGALCIVQPVPLGRQHVWQRVKSSKNVGVGAPCVLNVRFAHDVETGSVFEARGLGIVGFLGQVSIGVISKGCGSA